MTSDHYDRARHFLDGHVLEDGSIKPEHVDANAQLAVVDAVRELTDVIASLVDSRKAD